MVPAFARMTIFKGNLDIRYKISRILLKLNQKPMHHVIDVLKIEKC